MLELLGIPVSATRRKCALLSLKVVRHALTGRRQLADRFGLGACTDPDGAITPASTAHPDRYTRLYGHDTASPIVENEKGELVAVRGVSREVIQELSRIKDEPDWMAERRLEVLRDLRAQADAEVGLSTSPS